MNNSAKKIGPSSANSRVLLCKNVSTVDVLRLATEHNIKQIVQESNPTVDLEMGCSLVMQNAPDTFFEYPMSTVLSPLAEPSYDLESQACLYKTAISCSDEKSRVIGEMTSAVAAVSRRTSLLEDVRLVADELISNAFFNAPFVTSKLIISRQEKITLQPGKAAQMMIGADSERLVIVCEDRFGSLDINTFLNRVKSGYESGLAQIINFGEGGAGIGSHMIFDTCISLYCAVDRGNRTIFGCVFPLGKKYRNRADLSKNIHIIER